MCTYWTMGKFPDNKNSHIQRGGGYILFDPNGTHTNTNTLIVQSVIKRKKKLVIRYWMDCSVKVLNCNNKLLTFPALLTAARGFLITCSNEAICWLGTIC